MNLNLATAARPARPKLTSMAIQSFNAKHKAVPPVQLSFGQSSMQASTARSRGGHTLRSGHARSLPGLAPPLFWVKVTSFVTLRLLRRSGQLAVSNGMSGGAGGTFDRPTHRAVADLSVATVPSTLMLMPLQWGSRWHSATARPHPA